MQPVGNTHVPLSHRATTYAELPRASGPRQQQPAASEADGAVKRVEEAPCSGGRRRKAHKASPCTQAAARATSMSQMAMLSPTLPRAAEATATTPVSNIGLTLPSVRFSTPLTVQ